MQQVREPPWVPKLSLKANSGEEEEEEEEGGLLGAEEEALIFDRFSSGAAQILLRSFSDVSSLMFHEFR